MMENIIYLNQIKIISVLGKKYNVFEMKKVKI